MVPKAGLSRRGSLNALIGAAIPFVHAVLSLSPLCLSLLLSLDLALFVYPTNTVLTPGATPGGLVPAGGGLKREPDEEQDGRAVRSLTPLYDRPTLRRIIRLFSCQTIGRLTVGAISVLWLCLPLVHNPNDDGILTNQQLARQ